MTDRKKSVGESAEWEAAYRQTRRSLPKRKRRLRFFDWPDRSATILDLGSGDGLDLLAMKSLGYSKAIAFDASPNLLSGVEGNKVVGDAHFLPFDDHTFQIVFANSVLHHFDFPEMVGEVARILVPGGVFCFMEPRPTRARSLLDTLTMNEGMGAWFSFLKHRKQSLMEEWEVYHRWLDLYPRVREILHQHRFALEEERNTMVGVLAQWKRV